MREKIPYSLAVALLVFLSAAAFAAPKKPVIPPPSAPLLTLGTSAVPLTGPWKFSPGDSPWDGDTPQWAQPTFDDSQWAPVDLTPPAGSFDPQLGTAGFLPGWTARGYPDLTGFAWYRLRIHVADPTQTLWLKMPDNFDDVYQVYVNGQYVGQFGEFTRTGVVAYYSLPASFAIPPPLADGQLQIAVRFYLSFSSHFLSPDAGGMHESPVLGLASTILPMQTAARDAYLHRYFGGFLGAFLFLLVAPLALWAWLADRKDYAWLWLFLALMFQALAGLIVAVNSLKAALPAATAQLWVDGILGTLAWTFWIIFWWQWFARGRQRWIPIAACLLGAVRIAIGFFLNSQFQTISSEPTAPLRWFGTASIACLAAVCVLLLVVLFSGIQRDTTEALIAAAPILLLVFAAVTRYLTAAFNLQFVQFPFGLGVAPIDFEQILMVLVIGAISMRRFLHNRVTHELSRQSLQQELEQAHELQRRVLVPENIHSPSFSVEAEYHPAQIVGGDFYQTVLGIDGSLLVIIGDVSGKGITAAMLVAVLVGAARTRANESFDPASMLATLNQRLSGRSGGHFATCLVAHLRPNGQLRIANAGHIPPYLNGCEIDLDGSLPLGIAGTLDPATKAFQLRPGDQLSFITDGVVEARNKKGELFGFERARVLSTASAEKIAHEAQAFGQDDDITVLRVAYVGERREAPLADFAISGRS